MKVSIAQLNPRLGDFTYNKEKIREAIKLALRDQSQILIIPFGSISGFPQGNLMASEDFRVAIQNAREELALETKDTELSVFVEGQEILTKGIVSREGFSQEILDHTHLPLPAIFNQNNYDIFVNLGPKIFEKNRPEAHEMELKLLANEKKSWVFDINLAGATDEILFTGLSSITNPEGKIIARLKYAQEDFITVDLESSNTYPVHEIPAGEEILRQTIVQGIRDYFLKNHFSKILVSVSGGIDSALVLVLAVEAVGAEKVHAVYLPSKFSSDISKNGAQKICDNLNVSLNHISIESLHKSYIQELSFLKDGNTIWEENIQARIRGNIVMSIANAEGSLVLATGNKTEASVGYCTLYGDMCGGFAPISDLLKTEVRALCRYINTISNKEIIPEITITRPPSAELNENQIDENSLPNYEFLDQVLFLHCEEGLDYPQICDRLERKEDVLKIFTLLYTSSYKRKQSPTGLKISKRYFGLDWHIPTSVGLWFKQ